MCARHRSLVPLDRSQLARLDREIENASVLEAIARVQMQNDQHDDNSKRFDVAIRLQKEMEARIRSQWAGPDEFGFYNSNGCTGRLKVRLEEHGWRGYVAGRKLANWYLCLDHALSGTGSADWLLAVGMRDIEFAGD